MLISFGMDYLFKFLWQDQYTSLLVGLVGGVHQSINDIGNAYEAMLVVILPLLMRMHVFRF